MKKIIKFILITIIFSACIKEVDYKLDFEGSKPVIFAAGAANQKLHAYITQTFAPLTEANPDSLLVNDALIEIYENDLPVDTMILTGAGIYESKIKLKINHKYHITAKSKRFDKIISEPDTVPVAAELLDAKVLKITPEKDTSYSYSIDFIYKFTIKKSVAFPYNDLTINYFSHGNKYEDYIFLSSDNEFIECDDCFDLFENPCSINKGNNIYEIKTKATLYNPDFTAEELDSIQFILETYTSLAAKLCQSGMDIEEYYGNPLPFASNPPVQFSNIKGGYGLFILENIDSMTIILK